jgi:hypothetical protein
VLISDLARDLISRGGEVPDRIEVDAQEAHALVRVPPEGTPVEFVVDLEGLQRFIESAKEDARDIFPDVDPIEGALRLISEHLWEEIGSAEARVEAVGVDRRGETWRRTGPVQPGTALPPGDYRWTADREASQGSDPRTAPW